jgi:hypothetical protein
VLLDLDATPPWPGDTGPLLKTPDRRPGSVRRTITVDADRPDGPTGDVIVTATGRDLLTADDGSPSVSATQRLTLRADYTSHQQVKQVAATPAPDRLDALVGLPSRHGFRRTARDLLAGDHRLPGLVDTILYDVPIVTGLSQIALYRRDMIVIRPADAKMRIECAGWKPGSTMYRRRGVGRDPNPNDGGVAPNPRRDDDPLAWHALPDLPPDGFRRWRRTDVWRAEGVLMVDAWWRDTYVAPDGALRIVHEYSVYGACDAASLSLTEVQAVPRALPGPECHEAAASAQVLVGLPLAALDGVVRSELSGYATCVHLNDQLHSLGDLPSLVACLG